MIRRTRFGSGPRFDLAQFAESQSQRVEIFTPTRGLHRGDAPQDLEPGFTPDASNFIVEGGFLMPRSGLSHWRGDASALTAPALGAFRVSDLTGSAFLATASTGTIAVFDPVSDAWRTLSADTAASLPSGTTRQYWDGAYLYDAAADSNLMALTNAHDLPKVFEVQGSVATYSNLTDFASIASKAVSVCAFDNRLVWFNTSTASLTQPTRVLWSVRGLPRNYQLIDGAGFEDLLDMRGVGTRVLPSREGILLFTDEEIWRGRKRGDAYVFDFYAIERNLGCPYPKTIVQTPVGTIFMAGDLELYVVRGDAVQPLGPKRPEEASRIQGFLEEQVYDPERTWATFNPGQMRYEIYYTGAESSDGYPTRALYYHITEESFFPQQFAHELSAGVAFADPGHPSQWDESVENWDAIATAWDEQVSAGVGYEVHTFSSAGTAYRFESTQTSDDGSAITAYWMSHAMNRQDQLRMETLNSLWLEHKQANASALSVSFAGDFGFTNEDTYNVALPAGQYARTLVPGLVTGAAPHFRLQVTDGGKPHIGRFQAHLVEAGLFGGAR